MQKLYTKNLDNEDYSAAIHIQQHINRIKDNELARAHTEEVVKNLKSKFTNKELINTPVASYQAPLIIQKGKTFFFAVNYKTTQDVEERNKNIWLLHPIYTSFNGHPDLSKIRNDYIKNKDINIDIQLNDIKNMISDSTSNKSTRFNIYKIKQ